MVRVINLQKLECGGHCARFCLQIWGIEAPVLGLEACVLDSITGIQYSVLQKWKSTQFVKLN